MKCLLKFSIFVATLLLSANVFATKVLSPPSSSSASLTTERLKKQLKKVSMQTAALQQELIALKSELHQESSAHKNTKPSGRAQPKNVIFGYTEHHGTMDKTKKETKQKAVAKPAQQPVAPKAQPKTAKQQEKGLPPKKHHFWTIFRHPVTVTTSPFMGIRSAFDASDLLEQQSTMNEDLTLLKQRARLAKLLQAAGYNMSRPIIEISGAVAGDAIYSDGTGGFAGSSSSINLNNAELDFEAVASKWANAFISVDYDDSPALTGTRVPNSRIYLRRGFLTIGNLNVTNFYLTIGQFYMPFGRFASQMVTAPLTLSMARILARGVILGYSRDGFYAQLYGYEGNQTSVKGLFFKQGGFNLGLKHDIKLGAFDFGAGIVSNIADSEGMQNTATGTLAGFFHGFGESPGVGNPPPENLDDLRHRVPAVDVHGELNLGKFTFIAEYITSVRSFNPNDLTFDGVGAEPKALHAEIDYTFYAGVHPLSFGTGYGQTWQAFALNLPEKSIFAVFQTSIWKDTIESIEYRHDYNYPNGTTGTGGFVNGVGRIPVQFAPGGSRNLVTAQIGVYF